MRVPCVCVVVLFAAAATVEATAIRGVRGNDLQHRGFQKRSSVGRYEDAEARESVSPDIKDFLEAFVTARDFPPTPHAGQGFGYDDVLIIDDGHEKKYANEEYDDEEDDDEYDQEEYDADDDDDEDNNNTVVDSERSGGRLGARRGGYVKSKAERGRADSSIRMEILRLQEQIRQGEIARQRAQKQRRLAVRRRNAMIQERNRKRRIQKKRRQQARRRNKYRKRRNQLDRKRKANLQRNRRIVIGNRLKNRFGRRRGIRRRVINV